MSDQIKTEQQTEAHIRPSELNAGLGNERIKMINLVELCSDEQHKSPCANGNIIDGHACYCHAQADDAPRKCPIWRNYGEGDMSKWNCNGDFNDDDWNGGCKLYAPNVKLRGSPASGRVPLECRVRKFFKRLKNFKLFLYQWNTRKRRRVKPCNFFGTIKIFNGLPIFNYRQSVF
jgi:hypothetical protein